MTERGAKVVRIPRDWYGPKDQLVPFGPFDADEASEPADDASGVEGPRAEDFWTGAASLDAFVPCPEDDGSFTGRPPIRLPGRPVLVGAAAALAGLALVGPRLLAGSAATRPSRLALSALGSGAVVDRQSVDHRHVFHVPHVRHVRRAVHHRRALHARGSATATHAAAVTYSPPAAPATTPPATPPPATPSQTYVASTDTSAGSATAAQAGPVGPGAAFGPGQLGK